MFTEQKIKELLSNDDLRELLPSLDWFGFDDTRAHVNGNTCICEGLETNAFCDFETILSSGLGYQKIINALEKSEGSDYDLSECYVDIELSLSWNGRLMLRCWADYIGRIGSMFCYVKEDIGEADFYKTVERLFNQLFKCE